VIQLPECIRYDKYITLTMSSVSSVMSSQTLANKIGNIYNIWLLLPGSYTSFSITCNYCRISRLQPLALLVNSPYPPLTLELTSVEGLWEETHRDLKQHQQRVSDLTARHAVYGGAMGRMQTTRPGNLKVHLTLVLVIPNIACTIAAQHTQSIVAAANQGSECTDQLDPIVFKAKEQESKRGFWAIDRQD